MPEETPFLESKDVKSSLPEFDFEEVHLETKLLASFQWKDFEALNLPPFTYPKMLRGLPRFYHKASPLKCNIKKPFAVFLQLKKTYIDKAKLYLYHNVVVKGAPRIALLAKLEENVEGDLLSIKDLTRLIKKHIPSAIIETFLSYPEKYSGSFFSLEATKTIYKEGKKSLFSKSHLASMKDMDLLLQYPTYFPQAKNLLQILKKQGFSGSHELLGKAGSIEMPPFLDGGRSLGLHFLEKGMLIHNRIKMKKRDWLSLPITKTILGNKNISLSEVEHYLENTRLNYFDVTSKKACLSGFAYVLTKQQGKREDLDFFLPETIHSEEMISQLKSLAKPSSFRSIHFYYQKKKTYYRSKEGKGALRIFFLANLSEEERLLFIDYTKDLLIVKDDWGFGKALLSKAPYFYDRSHGAKSFVKDLISLGEYYLSYCPKAVSYLRFFLKNQPEEEEKTLYLEEEFFQGKETRAPLFTKEILDEEAVEALLNLNRVIIRYFSANLLTVSLVKRSLLHKRVPKLAAYEKKLEEQYLYGSLSFSSFIEQMRFSLLPHNVQE